MYLDLSNKETALLEAIRSYLMMHGKMPSTRSLMRDLNYKSPRSVTVLLQTLTEKGALTKKTDGSLALEDFSIEDQGDRALTVKVPLLGSVSCGLPMLAEENVEAQISVSTELIEKDQRYFFLQASGDSMNKKGIDDGDLVMIRQENSAKSGDLVVALIDDEATIKELLMNPDHIVLKPCSSNRIHQPIILTRNFRVQGVVVSVIKGASTSSATDSTSSATGSASSATGSASSATGSASSATGSTSSATGSAGSATGLGSSVN